MLTKSSNPDREGEACPQDEQDAQSVDDFAHGAKFECLARGRATAPKLLR